MMKKRLMILAALVCAFAVFALPVSAADETPASTETSGENWTDPETGYVYKDGVNDTTQGDIALYSEDGETAIAEEAAPLDSVPKTGASGSKTAFLAAAAAGSALLLAKKRGESR